MLSNAKFLRVRVVSESDIDCFSCGLYMLAVGRDDEEAVWEVKMDIGQGKGKERVWDGGGGGIEGCSAGWRERRVRGWS